MANIRGNYFRPTAVCGIRALPGCLRRPVDGVESHPESEIRDFSPGGPLAYRSGAGVAALGLHLLGADAAGGSPGAMTAAVVVLVVGGAVTPSGEVSVAGGAPGRTPKPPWTSCPWGCRWPGRWSRRTRSCARCGPGRVAASAALLVATAGGLAWAGHDVVTLEGTASPPKSPAKVEVPGIGDVGGLLPDRIGHLIETRTRVGFSVEPGPTLLGAGVWALAVVAVALLVSRRGPAALARLRPAASAVVAMLLGAVAAGPAAAVWAALSEEAAPGEGRRVLGAALLGAPNGSWLGVLLRLFVPLRGRATGASARLLPDPLDDLLAVSAREPVTLGRLAEYDGRSCWPRGRACCCSTRACWRPYGVRGAGSRGARCGCRP